MKKILLAGLATGLVMIGSAGMASADDFDFSGTFRQDNDVLRFNFTVGDQSDVTVFSSSWLSSSGGGFDPILAVWDSTGLKMSQQDDGGVVGTTFSNGVEYAHGTWDSYYTVNLSAGAYTATIAQYNNFSVSNLLSDGFAKDNNPNFTFDQNYGGATQPLFNGVWDNNDPRTGNWAFHLLNVAQAEVDDPNAAVPEPATMLLFGTGLAGLAAAGRRKAKK